MSRKPEKADADNPGPVNEARAGEDAGFFRRWSERKRRARAGRESEPAAAATASAPQAEPLDAAEKTADRVLTDEDMPSLESLTEDSDYSGFFSPGVSERLRRAALRKLFLSPKLNVVDGLDDYAEDYRSFEALGDIITSDMRFDAERQAERAKQSRDEETREARGDAEIDAANAAENEHQSPESTDDEPTDDSDAAGGSAGGTSIAAEDRDRPRPAGESAPEDKSSRG